MKLKRGLILMFFLLAGIVVGGMLASLCEGVGFLSWLSYAGAIGVNPTSPLVLDLWIIQLSFGFAMSISVAQIITVGLAIFLYTRLKIK